MRLARQLVTSTAVLGLLLSACSTKGAGTQTEQNGDLKTDVGVTEDEIVISALTDWTGPFKTNGLGYTAGNKIWANEVNANGGICGRDITLDFLDTGYKPDNAVPMYENVRQNSVALIQMVGSPVVAALKPKLTSDNMLTVVAGGTSYNLDTDSMLMVGMSYDIEILNGMAYLQGQGMISDGDKVGAVYVDNEGGQNMLDGLKAYAEEHDIELVENALSASDSDLTASVTKLKQAGVSAIAITGSTGATSSLAIQTQSQGFEVPIVATTPAYATSMVANPGTVEALGNFYLSTAWAAWGSDGELMQKIVDEYESTSEDPPDPAVIIGYVSGMALGAILEQACENEDMTRAGLLKARVQIANLDTDGLSGPLDFSDPGAPATRHGYILGIDANAPVGLTTLQGLTESAEAEAFKTPYQK